MAENLSSACLPFQGFSNYQGQTSDIHLVVQLATASLNPAVLQEIVCCLPQSLTKAFFED